VDEVLLQKTNFKTHLTYMWLLDDYMCPQQFDVWLEGICIWVNPFKKFENEKGWEGGNTSLKTFFFHDHTIGCKHAK
jgi:hypothetical protein